MNETYERTHPGRRRALSGNPNPPNQNRPFNPEAPVFIPSQFQRDQPTGVGGLGHLPAEHRPSRAQATLTFAPAPAPAPTRAAETASATLRWMQLAPPPNLTPPLFFPLHAPAFTAGDVPRPLVQPPAAGQQTAEAAMPLAMATPMPSQELKTFLKEIMGGLDTRLDSIEGMLLATPETMSQLQTALQEQGRLQKEAAERYEAEIQGLRAAVAQLSESAAASPGKKEKDANNNATELVPVPGVDQTVTGEAAVEGKMEMIVDLEAKVTGHKDEDEERDESASDGVRSGSPTPQEDGPDPSSPGPTRTTRARTLRRSESSVPAVILDVAAAPEGVMPGEGGPSANTRQKRKRVSVSGDLPNKKGQSIYMTDPADSEDEDCVMVDFSGEDSAAPSARPAAAPAATDTGNKETVATANRQPRRRLRNSRP